MSCKLSPMETICKTCQHLFSDGDNLHDMSNPVSGENKKKKYFNMSSAEIFTQSSKHLSLVADDSFYCLY